MTAPSSTPAYLVASAQQAAGASGLLHLNGIDLPALPYKEGDPSRVGIMGGTFDPIHYGHLVAAEQAAEDLELDVVIFMAAGSPAFKQDRRVSSSEDRFAMTLLATADNPRFVASRLEIERPGITYTADTLAQIAAAYPSSVELFFITGADAVVDIVHWHDAARIASLATLVGATRPGYDLERARQAINESPIDFQVIYLEVPALAISSSYLRRRCAAGQSLRYLTPDTVCGYIRKHHLYGWEQVTGETMPSQKISAILPQSPLDPPVSPESPSARETGKELH